MTADLPDAEPVDEQPPATSWLEYLRWGIPGYGTSATTTDAEPYMNPNFR